MTSLPRVTQTDKWSAARVEYVAFAATKKDIPVVLTAGLTRLPTGSEEELHRIFNYVLEQTSNCHTPTAIITASAIVPKSIDVHLVSHLLWPGPLSGASMEMSITPLTPIESNKDVADVTYLYRNAILHYKADQAFETFQKIWSSRGTSQHVVRIETGGQNLKIYLFQTFADALGIEYSKLDEVIVKKKFTESEMKFEASETPTLSQLTSKEMVRKIGNKYPAWDDFGQPILATLSKDTQVSKDLAKFLCHLLDETFKEETPTAIFHRAKAREIQVYFVSSRLISTGVRQEESLEFAIASKDPVAGKRDYTSNGKKVSYSIETILRIFSKVLEGVSDEHVVRFESWGNKPRMFIFKSEAEALGTTPQELVRIAQTESESKLEGDDWVIGVGESSEVTEEDFGWEKVEALEEEGEEEAQADAAPKQETKKPQIVA